MERSPLPQSSNVLFPHPHPEWVCAQVVGVPYHSHWFCSRGVQGTSVCAVHSGVWWQPCREESLWQFDITVTVKAEETGLTDSQSTDEQHGHWPTSTVCSVQGWAELHHKKTHSNTLHIFIVLIYFYPWSVNFTVTWLFKWSYFRLFLSSYSQSGVD